jgi:hypothetical protein
MSIPLSFSNLWPGLLDQKHYTWKNHEAQSPTNQTLKDEIKKSNKNNENKNQNKK